MLRQQEGEPESTESDIKQTEEGKKSVPSCNLTVNVLFKLIKGNAKTKNSKTKRLRERPHVVDRCVGRLSCRERAGEGVLSRLTFLSVMHTEVDDWQPLSYRWIKVRRWFIRAGIGTDLTSQQSAHLERIYNYKSIRHPNYSSVKMKDVSKVICKDNILSSAPVNKG